LILATYCKSKRKPIIALKTVIIEMKQTATVSLLILGLNEDFVQVNEVMTIWCFLLLSYLNTHHPINHDRSLYIRKLPLG